MPEISACNNFSDPAHERERRGKSLQFHLLLSRLLSSVILRAGRSVLARWPAVRQLNSFPKAEIRRFVQRSHLYRKYPRFRVKRPGNGSFHIARICLIHRWINRVKKIIYILYTSRLSKLNARLYKFAGISSWKILIRRCVIFCRVLSRD